MLVDVGSKWGTLRVLFGHGPRYPGNKLDHTRCIIEMGEEDHVISTGVALLHPRDNFCRAIGRKVALTKALANSPFNKEQRGKVWSAYWEHHKK